MKIFCLYINTYSLGGEFGDVLTFVEKCICIYIQSIEKIVILFNFRVQTWSVVPNDRLAIARVFLFNATAQPSISKRI